jgi:hypothetical protein
MTNLLTLPLAKFNQHLASIGAAEKAHECLWGLLNPFHDRFFPFDFALFDPASHVGHELALHGGIIGYDEALDFQAFSDDID